jgi:hypothetical protein
MPKPAEQLSLEAFTPLVNDTFYLVANDQPEIPVRLSAVKSLGWNIAEERGGRESFSLLFCAPPTATLSQGICVFTHPAIGSHSLFQVPVGRDAEGLHLEVIFNFA